MKSIAFYDGKTKKISNENHNDCQKWPPATSEYFSWVENSGVWKCAFKMPFSPECVKIRNKKWSSSCPRISTLKRDLNNNLKIFFPQILQNQHYFVIISIFITYLNIINYYSQKWARKTKVSKLVDKTDYIQCLILGNFFKFLPPGSHKN